MAWWDDDRNYPQHYEDCYVDDPGQTHWDEYCHANNWFFAHGGLCWGYVCYAYRDAASGAAGDASVCIGDRKWGIELACEETTLRWLTIFGPPMSFHQARDLFDLRDWAWMYNPVQRGPAAAGR